MSHIITAIVGLLCIVLGILHCLGNVSLLHSYHKKRVSEEDKLPFAKTIGWGAIIIGVSIVLLGILSFLSEYLQNPLYSMSGNGVMIGGMIICCCIIFFAMMKYNKGIF